MTPNIASVCPDIEDWCTIIAYRINQVGPPFGYSAYVSTGKSDECPETHDYFDDLIHLVVRDKTVLTFQHDGTNKAICTGPHLDEPIPVQVSDIDIVTQISNSLPPDLSRILEDYGMSKFASKSCRPMVA